MMNRSLRHAARFLLTVAIAGTLATALSRPDSHETPRHFLVADIAVDARMSMAYPAFLQVFFDDGLGFREDLSGQAMLSGGGTSSAIRIAIPARRFERWRIDPINGDASVRIRHARILDASGRAIEDLTPDEFHATHDIASLSTSGGELAITPTPGPSDPQLTVSFSPPLDLRESRSSRILHWIARTVVLTLAGLALHRQPSRVSLDRLALLSAGLARRSVMCLAVAAGIVAMAASYPVIFLGRSYVSPNFREGTYLLYGTFPTLPDAPDAVLQSSNGSDVGAMAWQNVPYSMLHHAAWVEDHTLPRWNRFNSCGNTHVGQGQTMLGDPLHALPVLANGSAWAWDFKFVLAKWIFSFGVGLAVWIATRNFGAALLSSVSSGFIGFFLFRVNHPAVFSLCYSPWILVSWFGATRAPTWQALIPWALGALLSGWCVINSGTIKEAYILLVGLNGTGALVALLSPLSPAGKLRLLGLFLAAGVILTGLSAPAWMPFLGALRHAYSIYETPLVWQIHPSLLLGFFDEVFYRPFFPEHGVWNPSINFLSGAGVLYAAVAWRETRKNAFALPLVLAAIPPFALAFGMSRLAGSKKSPSSQMSGTLITRSHAFWSYLPWCSPDWDSTCASAGSI